MTVSAYFRGMRWIPQQILRHGMKFYGPRKTGGPGYSVLTNVIYDRLLVKSNLADVPILSSTDVDFIVDNLCVS